MQHPSEYSKRPPVYGAAGPDYFRAGWQPIPLGKAPGEKWPPVTGYTGAEGRLIGSIERVRKWAGNGAGQLNLGLHLLHPFVGIDVDTYGEKNGAATLASLEAALGPLPPTIVSSARPDPELSGIRVFRLPGGVGGPRLTADAQANIEREHGPDIDIIRHDHRYIVAWPSTNPDADGASYRWYRQTPGGVEPVEDVPSRDDVAELPVTWAQFLLAGSELTQARKAVPAAPRIAAPRDPELDEFGIDLADPTVQPYTEAAARAEIEQWLAEVRATRKGKINEVFKDAVSHLWHFVPVFLTADEARALLIEAQRKAWIASGKPDNGDYSQANATIDRTERVYVPQQIKTGQWWTAELIEDDPEPEGPEEEGDFDGDETESLAERRERAARERFEKQSAPTAEGIADHLRRTREKEIADKRHQAEVENEARQKAPKMLDRYRAEHVRRLPELRDRPAVDWLIDGWIPSGCIGMVFADEGVGKTFWLVDVLARIAIGRPVFGCRASKGRVMLIAGEGEDDIHERIEAWVEVMDGGESPLSSEERDALIDNLLVHDGPLQIGDPEVMAILSVLVETENLAMVVFDTQQTCADGFDEDNNQAMTELTNRLRSISRIKPQRPAVFTVGHPGHSATNKDRPKGAKNQLANHDVLIRLDRVGDTQEIKFQHRKLKRGKKMQAQYVKLVEAPIAGSLAIAHVDGSDKLPTREDDINREIEKLEVGSGHMIDYVLAALVALCRPGVAAPLRTELKAATACVLKQPISGNSQNSRYSKARIKLVEDGLAECTKDGARVWPTREGFAARGEAYVPAPWARPDEDDPDDDNGVAESIRMAEAAIEAGNDIEAAP